MQTVIRLAGLLASTAGNISKAAKIRHGFLRIALGLMQREAEISLEVSDNRLFCGCWAYMTIAYWLGDSSGPAADLVIDPYTGRNAAKQF
jgi:hypothetical protein